MSKIGQYITYGVIIAFGVVASLGGYARIWEARQPKQHLRQVKLRSIEPYSRTNDLHWSLRGNRVHISGEDRVIDFPLKNWDSTVKEDDTVDMIVRESFPLFGLVDELDGLMIDDYK